MTGVLTKGGHLDPETDTHRGQAMRTDTGRDWPSAGQGEGPGTALWLAVLRRANLLTSQDPPLWACVPLSQAGF